jgi:hypothetical protein
LLLGLGAETGAQEVVTNARVREQAIDAILTPADRFQLLNDGGVA